MTTLFSLATIASATAVAAATTLAAATAAAVAPAAPLGLSPVKRSDSTFFWSILINPTQGAPAPAPATAPATPSVPGTVPGAQAVGSAARGTSAAASTGTGTGTGTGQAPKSDVTAIDMGDLVPVAPGEDGDPGRARSIDPRVSLRVDDSFAGTYSVRGTDFFARRASGLYAVYPRGEYVRYAGRDVAVVPAGTVYTIGETDISRTYGSDRPTAHEPSRASSGHSAARSVSITRELPPERDAQGSRMLRDPAYRSERLQQLLAPTRP